jgi:Leucine-rich repeat (LRR) protein
MGGIGFAIELEPTSDAPDPKGLYDAMYALVETNIRKLAKGKPYTQVTSEYLSLARDDGWGRDEEIFFNFKDGGGCNMSADAGYHWFELVVAALREKDAFEPLAASHGLRLRWKKPQPLKALLARCDEPLVELRGKLFSTGKLDGEIFITSDDTDDEPITIDDLSKAERAKVVAAFTKKKCARKVCTALRSKPALVLPKPKKPAKDKPTPKRTKRYGNALYIRDASLTVLGPRNLRGTITGLQINAPIADLPDELEKHPIRWMGLGGTNITHVPHVLARIAPLEHLVLDKNPIALAELAELSGLRQLWISEWPDIPLHELPFEALPNLEHLRVTNCKLRTLPALGALKVLEVYGNAFESVPDAILRAATLEELDLGSNPLTSVPRSWASLPRLRKLELAGAITEIGDGLDAIEELDLGGTKVERLNASTLASLRVLRAPTTLREIDALPAKLESLGLYETKITSLPDVRAAKTSLKVLMLQYARGLAELPEWLGELEALEELTLDATAITRLPESMQKLRKLRTLGLRGTKVFPVPDWFAKLKALEELSVYKDDLPKGEAARLKKLLPKTKIIT